MRLENKTIFTSQWFHKMTKIHNTNNMKMKTWHHNQSQNLVPTVLTALDKKMSMFPKLFFRLSAVVELTIIVTLVGEPSSCSSSTKTNPF